MDYIFGPRIEDGGVRFRLWAPSADRVCLDLRGGESAELRGTANGWKEAFLSCGEGARYRFRIGNTVFPDPASRAQDGGVHGWSIVCASEKPKTSWHGRNWRETVLYETHTGLAGGFAGVAKDIPRLNRLGITAVELMPIAAFPGARNWGYDGVLPFAPAEAYGTPGDLRMAIESAHAANVMMFLDVVYNHFGPDGNYLPLYAKPFFRDDIHTPWGAAIDFRQEMVRRFFMESALYWIHEFGFDGLRFDAVHAVRDDGWLDELARELRASSPDRAIHLVLENEANSAARLRNGFTAQWNDDFHHVLHVILSGESAGYYADFAAEPAAMLARALAEGFVYQGQVSEADGKPRGEQCRDLSPTCFVSFLQNHDQIGNRAFGERLTVLARPKALKAAIALLLLSPQIPLIFMGEEIGSKSPFLYFTDHEPELAKAVREGRRKEFAAFHDRGADALPDPNAKATFLESDPDRLADARDEWSDYYRSLLSLRSRQIAPYCDTAKSLGGRAVGPQAVTASWLFADRRRLTVATNLSQEAVEFAAPAAPPIWGDTPAGKLAAETTLAWLE